MIMSLLITAAFLDGLQRFVVDIGSFLCLGTSRFGFIINPRLDSSGFLTITFSRFACNQVASFGITISSE